MKTPVIQREWAMPNPATFQIPPIATLLERHLMDCEVIVDPFSGESTWGTHRNDLRFGGVDAIDWLDGLIADELEADAVLLDPPYSPRQVKEVYDGHGITTTTESTQTAKLYRRAKQRLDQLLKLGGTAITCGWSSVGFGRELGYEQLEILMVCHGGAHNDTIVVVEQKVSAKRLEGMW